MGITQPAEVDIETRPECSQNWEQVFVECDTTEFWQERGISKDRDRQKGADGETQAFDFLKCNQAEISEADALYYQYSKPFFSLAPI